MSEPTTAAGRALLDGLTPFPYVGAEDTPEAEWVGDCIAHRNDMSMDIVAIEREAVAAYLASPEAVEELARALWLTAYPSDDPTTDDPPVMEVGDLSDSGTATTQGLAAALLAALRDQRGAS